MQNLEPFYRKMAPFCKICRKSCLLIFLDIGHLKGFWILTFLSFSFIFYKTEDQGVQISSISSKIPKWGMLPTFWLTRALSAKYIGSVLTKGHVINMDIKFAYPHWSSLRVLSSPKCSQGPPSSRVPYSLICSTSRSTPQLRALTWNFYVGIYQAQPRTWDRLGFAGSI
jgi:hypothetical protein